MQKTFHKCAEHKMTNVQMCKKPSCTKCANLQRKFFSKCNFCKSALCTKTQMQISAHVTFLSVQISLSENFCVMCEKIFLFVK